MKVALPILAILAATLPGRGDVFFDSDRGIGKTVCTPGYMRIEGPIKDWSRYEHLVVDFVNVAYASPEDSLHITVYPESKAAPRVAAPCHYPTSFSTNRYWMALSGWAESASTNVAHVYVTRKGLSPANLRMVRAHLVRKGERPAPPVWRKSDLREVEETNRVFRAAAEKRRMASLDAFRAACRSAGQPGDRCIGEARASEQVRPRASFSARPAKRFRMRLARNEHESLQVLVVSRKNERDVRVAVDDLHSADGVFAASNITVSVMGYVETKSFPPNRIMAEDGTLAYPEMGWYPDPILDYTSACDIKKDDVQSFWVRVHCPQRQSPGVYRGRLRVVFPDETKTFPFIVRVNGFSLPSHAPCPLAVSYSPGFSPPIGSDPEYVRMCNWKRWNPLRWAPDGPIGLAEKRRDDWAFFLADYGLTMDSLYHASTNLPWDVFSVLKRQGRLGLFNLGVWGENPRFKGDFMRVIRTNHAEASRRGLLSHVYIYGFDETPRSRFAAISNAIAEIKREFPDVPFLTTAFDPSLGVKEPALAPIDWFTPSITTNCYDPVKVKASRAAGHKVWWYTCCFPHAPYPQLFLDAQPVETRLLLGAMAAKMRPDGFLYYQTSIWNSDRPITGGPFTGWNPDSYYNYHGDGSLLRVGPDGMPLATQRLENFRDGLEDLWYVLLLRQRDVEVPVPDSLVKNTADFSRDPARLERWRNQLADMIESYE